MLKVKVEYLGFIKNMLNKRKEEFKLEDGASLQELLSKVSTAHGSRFRKEVFNPGNEQSRGGIHEHPGQRSHRGPADQQLYRRCQPGDLLFQGYVGLKAQKRGYWK